ncbi:hypothetical protein TNCV_1792311 [Trichonephila clavipes]|nr:hypothetical protein TNCV_1792311 [Trichonephila clavipes]
MLLYSWPQQPNGIGNALKVACHEFEPSTAEDPSCRVQVMHGNLSKLKPSPINVVWKFGERDASSGFVLVA